MAAGFALVAAGFALVAAGFQPAAGLILLLALACGIPEAPPAGDPVLAALQAQPLVETKHGACRMACRHIDRAEVEHVLATGTLDPARTRDDGECPSYAIVGLTPDGQRARVVLAGCPTATKVVTVVDLDTDWPCTCE